MSTFQNIAYDESDSKFQTLKTVLIEKLKQIFDLEEYDTIIE